MIRLVTRLNYFRDFSHTLLNETLFGQRLLFVVLHK